MAFTPLLVVFIHTTHHLNCTLSAIQCTSHHGRLTLGFHNNFHVFKVFLFIDEVGVLRRDSAEAMTSACTDTWYDMWYDSTTCGEYRNHSKSMDQSKLGTGQVISLHFLSMRVHWPWHLAGANEYVQNLPRQLSRQSRSSQIYPKRY